MLLLLAGLLSTPHFGDAGNRENSGTERAPTGQRIGGEDASSPPDPSSPTGPEGPFHKPADSDDLRLVVEPLDPEHPRHWRGSPRRTVRNAVRLAALATAVVALAAVFTSTLRGASPTAQPTPAPTPAPSLPRGWAISGPPYAQAIAFALSAPAIAYTCGAVALDEPGAPPAVYVGISHDFGRSWQTLPAPLLSPWCDITVDPTDPQDAALLTEVCAACSANPSLSVYRTTDGGDNWSQWPLPAWGAGGRDVFSGYEWAWAGSTLFVAQAIGDGRSGYTLLAASVNREPFVWVGQHGLFAGEPATAGIDSLTGLDGALYVTFNCGPGCPLTSTHTMRTSDGGRTWTPFTPAYQGHTVYLTSTRAASASLFGFTAPAPGESITSGGFLRSADGGQTWQPLPPFPDMLGLVDIAAAPDGTTYAQLWACCGPVGGTAPEGIYKLPPGATLWSFVSRAPGGTSSPIVLSLGTDGHTRALWSPIHQAAGPFQVIPGMADHLP